MEAGAVRIRPRISLLILYTYHVRYFQLAWYSISQPRWIQTYPLEFIILFSTHHTRYISFSLVWYKYHPIKVAFKPIFIGNISSSNIWFQWLFLYVFYFYSYINQIINLTSYMGTWLLNTLFTFFFHLPKKKKR